MNGTLTFTAFAAPTTPTSPPVTDVRATSNTVSVTNTGWAGTVSLTVSRDQVDVHNTYATVTATTSVALRPPYKLTIYDADTGQQVGWCEGVSTSSSCAPPDPASLSKMVTVNTNVTRRFVAYVAQDSPSSAFPSNDVRATSNTVSVTNTGWAGTVSLTVSRDQVDVHNTYATVTATTSVALRPPYKLTIYDADTGQQVGWCEGVSTSSSCAPPDPASLSKMVTVNTNVTRTFVAYVAQDSPSSALPSNDVRATSNTVSVTNTGWAGTVSLTVSRDQVDVHNTYATVTATTSVALRPPYKLTIYDADTGQQVGWCESVSTSSCYDTNKATLSKTIWVSEANATRRFVAYVAQDYPSNSLPTNDVRATSNTASVTNTGWTGKVTLTRSAANPDSLVWFTAETKPALAGPYFLAIYDSSGQLIKRCAPAYPCSGTATATTMSAAVPKDGISATRTFVAYVARDFPTSGVPTNDVRAISGHLTTTGDGAIRPGELDGGYNPSEACTTGCAGDPINTATGEFWETTTDVEIPGASGGLAVRRSFATARNDIDGPFGYGWSWQFGMQLAIANGATGTTLDTASQLRLTQENGSALLFTRGTDGTYSAPPRTFATLSRNADGSFTFIRGKKQIYQYSPAGDLTAVTNVDGTTYQSYKEGDMVAAITSAAAALPGLGAGARVLGLASRSARASATGATIARSGSWYSTAGKLSDWVGIGAPWFNYTLMSGAAVWKASGTCA